MLRVDENKCRHESLAAKQEVTTSDRLTAVNTLCGVAKTISEDIDNCYHCAQEIIDKKLEMIST